MILLVASTFMGSVFSALGTPTFIAKAMLAWDIHPGLLIIAILLLCFVLGWPLEWVPIVVIIVPIFLPILIALKVDMVWFSILLAVTLQTCWLSPPVALSAYYLKGVMPQVGARGHLQGNAALHGPAMDRGADPLFLPADHSGPAEHDVRNAIAAQRKPKEDDHETS